MQLTPNPYDLKLKLVCPENIERLLEYQMTGSCFPMAIEISPTNRCNLNCTWCISKQYHKDESLDMDVLLKFLYEYKEMGGKSITWSGGGEPTTYKGFLEGVWYADSLGLDQGMMTNGTFSGLVLNAIAEKMQWVRISLDTVDRHRYVEMKGVSLLDKVMGNIQALVRHTQPRARVIVNMNLSKVNEDEVMVVARTSKFLGADRFQLRPVLPIPSDMTYYVPDNLDDIIAELETLNGDGFFCHISHDKFYGIDKPREYTSCTYHNFLCVLNSNGDLSVCMYKLYEDAFTFGNIYRYNLSDIWASDKRKQVVAHCTDMDFSQCQVCCKGHELNTFLHYIEMAQGMRDRRFL